MHEHSIERCEPAALALYLFLVTVGDARGLSYYADATLERRLSLSQNALHQARESLIRVGLIAWRAPLYPMLSLDPPSRVDAAPRSRDAVRANDGAGQFRSLRELLRDSLGDDG